MSCVIEDEHYFVLECQRYIETKKKYIPKYYWQRSSMGKFIKLIYSDYTILKPSANQSTYIFTLVQKVKHRVYKIHVF